MGMGRLIIAGTYNGRVYLLCAASGHVLARIYAGDAVKGGAYVDPFTNTAYFGSHDGKLRQVVLCKPDLYSTPGAGAEVEAVEGGGGQGRWEGAFYSAPTPMDDEAEGWEGETRRIGQEGKGGGEVLARRLIACTTKGNIACVQMQVGPCLVSWSTEM